MKYKVIPFSTYIDHRAGFSKLVALQLEQLINKYSEQGWTYLRMETVSNHVSGNKGFFRFQVKPDTVMVSNMLVFIKK
ncbi:hypothetical protein [Aequorivita lipolytica]|uniref:DUF4177 domain-containing protein n=1 Tax=Aequorivita lipolytica TaxID=153267 RepID=A0A5C6YRK9_9FLAO|nr:hypothetical protein [Aequorivita lipolytica]TXD69990.1 hypothetical protein ESV24_06035 [Aequorivita lipolytica]SRX50183.1 hypothetical protein AEQU2_00652 [Aequorivita lipolytica]